MPVAMFGKQIASVSVPFQPVYVLHSATREEIKQSNWEVAGLLPVPSDQAWSKSCNSLAEILEECKMCQGSQTPPGVILNSKRYNG
jgi:hypothetical protein